MRRVAACRFLTFLDLMWADTSVMSWCSHVASQFGDPSAAQMRRAIMSKRLLSLWKMASVSPGLNIREDISPVGMELEFGRVMACLHGHMLIESDILMPVTHDHCE